MRIWGWRACGEGEKCRLEAGRLQRVELTRNRPVTSTKAVEFGVNMDRVEEAAEAECRQDREEPRGPCFRARDDLAAVGIEGFLLQRREATSYQLHGIPAIYCS